MIKRWMKLGKLYIKLNYWKTKKNFIIWLIRNIEQEIKQIRKEA